MPPRDEELEELTDEETAQLKRKFGEDNVVKGRQKRRPDDGEEKNPPPLNKGQGARFRRQPPPRVVSTPAGSSPQAKIEKKEVIMNEPIGVQGVQPRIFRPEDMEPCPLCGYRKPKEITIGDGKKVRPLVCKGCSDRYQQYGFEVARKLAGGEEVKVLSRHAWILRELDLARFGQELNEAFQDKERLTGLVNTKIQTHGHLPKEVFIPLRDTLQKEKLPGENMTASEAYGRWRRFQERLKAATEVRPQLEEMVAKETAGAAATHAAPTAPEAGVTPAVPPDSTIKPVTVAKVKPSVKPKAKKPKA